MDTAPLTDADQSLRDHAAQVNRESFDPEFFDGGHIVAAAVRTADGAIYDGVSLPTSVGRISACAEQGAVSAAIADGHAHDEIEACVAVSYPLPSHDAEDHRVVPPCGACRELLVDYNPEMRVVVPVDGENRTVRATELLSVRPW
ncbi:cytidine deaminase [Halolamina sp. CBA1230]|uniref:cytidine deaminase n=1 Tax=Halolamina sp. CBA1230 TaxID=1853690 RepID=UPI0009A1D36F|nr:cytidine deaminase [Halolamina sp. CBA1230]QKY19160.1 cytidine deaminase [Halolamina sp. CBA1230]